MKKTIFALVAFATLVMGCVKEQQPDQTPADVEKTILAITVDPTKAAVDETDGAVNFQTGDELAVWFQTGTEITGEGENAKETAVGTRVVFTHTGTLEDGSAKFEADAASIPAEFISAKAAYPAASLDAKGAFSLVRNYTYTPGSVPVYVRSENVVKNEDGNLSAQLSHNASIFKFTLHDIPAYAAGFVLETTKNEGATVIAIKTSFPYKTGYTADPEDHSNDIVIHSPAAHSSYVSRVYLVDGDGDMIEGSERKFKQTNNDISHNDYIIMPAIDFDKANLRKDYVKVCGVKWAKGNLQCVQNEGDATFQNGWRIAPYQWHNLHYKEASDKSGGKATAYGYSNDSYKFEHFNYGGIARQARFVSAGNYIVEPASDLDISGKVYGDVNATTEVTGAGAFKEIDTFTSAGNHNELWGDIAYWASKGQFRLPKSTEMVKLHNVSDKLAGYYKTSDGAVVYGYLFRTPNPSRVNSGTNQEFTDADLESGLFLPKAGRRGATAESSGTIINVMTQGMYRTGTYVKSVTQNKVLYYCSAYYSLGDAGKLADDNLKATISSLMNVGYANAHQAGHLVRPVLAE